MSQVVKCQGAAGAAGQRRQRQLARQLDTQVLQARTLDLENLHLQHHLRFRHLVHGDQLFGCLDGIGGIPHHDHVALFVDDNVARLQDRLDGIGDILRVAIAQHERAHGQRLVVALLGRCVGIDQDRVAVQHPLFELIRQEHRVDDVGDRTVAQEYRHLLIGADILVEHEVQARRTRQHFEHLPHLRVAEFEADRLAERRRQCALRAVSGGLFDPLLKGQCRPELLVFCQGEVQLGQCRIALAFLEGILGLLHQVGVPPVTLPLLKARPRSRVFRRKRQDTFVHLARRVGLAGLTQPFRFVQPTVDGPVPCLQIGRTIARVGRLGLGGGLESFETGFVLAFGAQRFTFAIGRQFAATGG